jgi:hypothetical protein
VILGGKERGAASGDELGVDTTKKPEGEMTGLCRRRRRADDIERPRRDVYGDPVKASEEVGTGDEEDLGGRGGEAHETPGS